MAPIPITRESRHAALLRTVKRLDAQIARHRHTADQLAGLRFVAFLAAIILALIAYSSPIAILFWGAALLAFIAFGILVSRHRRIKEAIATLRLWKHIKQTHLARLDLNWEALPASFESSETLAVDLDLVGARSIHRLLCTAATTEGAERLFTWLSTPEPDAKTISTRQALIKELVQRPIFGDKLTLKAMTAGERYNSRWEVSRLLRWLQQTAQRQSFAPRLRVLGILSLTNIILFLLNAAGKIPPIFVITLLIYIALYFEKTSEIGGLFEEALDLQDILGRLGKVLTFLETYPYPKTGSLKTVCAPFQENRPSADLRRIDWIVVLASLTHNQFSWLPVNIVVPWDMFFAERLNRRRAEIAAKMPPLLEIWFDLEAAGSLANFSYLNPDYAFPEIVTEPTFEASQIGHPMLPPDHKVCNSFTLTPPDQIALITGSNMSGKSTFLRTLGVNLCLAYAGGPVSAAKLRISLFRLFTCIRVTDSVADGYSYFYAEVRHLKALLVALEADHPLPLFFLIDEIFRGTNSRERMIGGRSYLRALVGKHGLGALATHDLELVKLADEYPQIVNYHFRDQIKDHQMSFDYRLQSGPCPTTNALQIMELAGLPVDVESV